MKFMSKSVFPKKVTAASLLIVFLIAADCFTGQVPEYSRLYQKVLELENSGLYGEALRIIPRIYEHEIPVQSFYDTLDKKKKELLEAGENKGFKIGGEEYSLISLGQILAGRLEQADYLHYDLRIPNELPPERYYYSLLLLEDGKIEEGLKSMDPWIVSGALFMARKSGSIEFARAVIQRWEKRPDLWDDVCTDMALLYLAILPPDKLNGLEINDSFIQTSMRKLTAIPEGTCFVHLMFFQSVPEPHLDFSQHNVDLFRYRRGKKQDTKRFAGDKTDYYDMTVEDKISLRANDFSQGIIPLNPGYYSFRHISGSGGSRGMAAVTHGKTGIFECKNGMFIRLFCRLTPGV